VQLPALPMTLSAWKAKVKGTTTPATPIAHQKGFCFPLLLFLFVFLFVFLLLVTGLLLCLAILRIVVREQLSGVREHGDHDSVSEVLSERNPTRNVAAHIDVSCGSFRSHFPYKF
jgi:hypothetical protein